MSKLTKLTGILFIGILLGSALIGCGSSDGDAGTAAPDPSTAAPDNTGKNASQGGDANSATVD